MGDDAKTPLPEKGGEMLVFVLMKRGFGNEGLRGKIEVRMEVSNEMRRMEWVITTLSPSSGCNDIFLSFQILLSSPHPLLPLSWKPLVFLTSCCSCLFTVARVSIGKVHWWFRNKKNEDEHTFRRIQHQKQIRMSRQRQWSHRRTSCYHTLPLRINYPDYQTNKWTDQPDTAEMCRKERELI